MDDRVKVAIRNTLLLDTLESCLSPLIEQST